MSVAAHEVGYNGSGTEDNPSSKYGAWYGIDGSLGYSNAQWCDMFVAWVFDQAGVTQIPPTRGSAAVRVAVDSYIEAGRHKPTSYNPNSGDLVFFQYGSYPDHIGIVETYVPESGLITSIQGNTTDSSMGRTGNCCRRKVHGRSYVVGFGVPAYVSSTSQGSLEDFMTDAEEEAKLRQMMQEEALVALNSFFPVQGKGTDRIAKRASSYVFARFGDSLQQHAKSSGTKLQMLFDKLVGGK